MVTVDSGVVEFSFFRPDAAVVFVAGDFNDWCCDQLALKRGENGYWTAKLRLPAGEYRFRYIADGQWFTDYAAFGVEQGPFGINSIVHVPQYRVAAVKKPAAVASRTRRVASVAA